MPMHDRSHQLSSASFRFLLPISFSRYECVCSVFACVFYLISMCCRSHLSSATLLNSSKMKKWTEKKAQQQLFVYTFSSSCFVDFIFIFALLLLCIFHSVAMNNAARTVENTEYTHTHINRLPSFRRCRCRRPRRCWWIASWIGGPSSMPHPCIATIFWITTLSVCAFGYYASSNARAIRSHHAWNTKYDGKKAHTHTLTCTR